MEASIRWCFWAQFKAALDAPATARLEYQLPGVHGW